MEFLVVRARRVIRKPLTKFLIGWIFNKRMCARTGAYVSLGSMCLLSTSSGNWSATFWLVSSRRVLISLKYRKRKVRKRRRQTLCDERVTKIMFEKNYFTKSSSTFEQTDILICKRPGHSNDKWRSRKSAQVTALSWLSHTNALPSPCG